MIVLLSPSKTLDSETPLPPCPDTTQPAFLQQSAELVELLKPASPEDLMALMGISHELAVLNVNRFQAWTRPFNRDNARPALFAFRGDVYEGLDARSLAPEDLYFAQQHLRILSGLYGLLRPLDLMRPYRLEMGTRLANARGTTLYQFWGETQTRSLNRDLLGLRQLSPELPAVVVNLASGEYFRVIRKALLQARVVTPSFLERKGDQYRMVSVHAKRARGLMARYILRHQIGDPAGLTSFDLEGYRYRADLSGEDTPVFTRDPGI